MRIIALADIHGRRQKVKRLQTQLADADLVLLVGDIGVFRKLEAGLAITDDVIGVAGELLAVAGNCDPVGLEAELAARGISVHARVRRVAGIQFAGLGGSLPCPSPTPHEYSEAELGDALHCCRRQLQPGPHILVSHQPPFDTTADFATINRHVGSRSVRDYIEATRPLACICGHIHEGRGIDHIGETAIINPGSFADNRYAEITATPETVTAELKSL